MWFYTLSLGCNWKSDHATSQRAGGSKKLLLIAGGAVNWCNDSGKGPDITCKQPTTHTADDPSITPLGNPREAIACVLQKPQTSKFL